MAVDSKGFVYIGQDTVRKYDPKTGQPVGETPRVPDRLAVNGEAALSKQPHIPGKGGPGPLGTFPGSVGGGPRPDPAAVAAFRAKYPPLTPMIVGNIEEIRLDEPAHELYATDNDLAGA